MLYPKGFLFYELKKKAIVEIIVYTTQVNSVFARADWLVRKWIAPNIYLQAANETKSRVSVVWFPTLFRYMERNKLIFAICVVYIKNIYHFSVGQ